MKAKKKTVVKKYRFASLAEYFEFQRRHYRGPKGSRHTSTNEEHDTHARFGERVGVSETTIARIVAGLADPSFTLAIRIAQEADCPTEAMGKNGVL